MSNSVLAIELGRVGFVLLIASVFLVTFAIVVVVAHLLIGAKKPGPAPSAASLGDTATPEAPATSEAVSTPAVASEPADPSDRAPQLPAVRVRLPKLSGLLAAINAWVRQPRQPRTSLTEAETVRAAELVRDGLPLSEAARVVYPEFDRLDAAAKLNIETTLQQRARTEKG